MVHHSLRLVIEEESEVEVRNLHVVVGHGESEDRLLLDNGWFLSTIEGFYFSFSFFNFGLIVREFVSLLRT